MAVQIQKPTEWDQMAEKLGVSVRYLKSCQRSGFPYSLAIRAAKLTGRPLVSFLKRGSSGKTQA